jgi:NIMA (never in mitosis gene a)-related kinase
MMNLSDKEKENALNEVRILASIKNEFVVSYKDAFIDETSQSLCIIMEFADDGDLFQKIWSHQSKGTYFPEKEIWSIFIQVLLGLKALHELKIMHRDLKSANVFLYKDARAKLGDLNVSKVAKEGLSYTQTGTPYYASPEVWKDQPYDNKSDIWSLGWVLYEAIALKPPFRAEDMQGLYKKVLKGAYPRIPKQFSPELTLMVKSLLTVHPEKRPSCDEILQMSWVSKKMSKLFPNEFEEIENVLLSTIRWPKNLMYLTDRLPSSSYHEDSMINDSKNRTKANSSTNDSQHFLPNIKRKCNILSVS